MPSLNDLTGKKIGRLTIIHRVPNKGKRRTSWLASCECGKNTIVASDDLKIGDSRSCGCLRVDRLKGKKIEPFFRETNPNRKYNKNCSQEEKYKIKVKEFWEKVEKIDDCWIWKGSFIKKYGCFTYGKIRLAHRFSYFIHNGELSEKMLICHKCDNPKCVNPDHLYQGTHKNNSDDKFARGRFNPRKKITIEVS
jgi:hypothetical protein